MQLFRFRNHMQKYFSVYTLVRSSGGSYDEDGEWRVNQAESITLRGSIQPLSASLKAGEGGNYLQSDRILFTDFVHRVDDILEYKDTRYRVMETEEREYSDLNKYVIRKVNAQ